MSVINKENYKERPILYLVVPCYNEEEVIDKSALILLQKENGLIGENVISPRSKILFVNDGSKDSTAEKLYVLAENNDQFALINFTTNYGHQAAIFAGMMAAKDHADIAVTIDADLQQDIEALDKFIACYKNGCDVVYGVRNDRNTDSFAKKFTATAYYGLMHTLGCNILANSADYRLLSKKALQTLSKYKESNLFLRGLIPTMGFSSDIVYFDVKEREAGSSKYTLKKMINLAIDGITSFSTVPLHMIFVIGCIAVFLSFILMVITIVEYVQGKNVPGYSTLLIVLLLMTGLIMLSLGIVGEYIGKIYVEAKGRPRYTIDSVIIRNTGDEND